MSFPAFSRELIAEATVVTANARLARRLRIGHDERRRAAGDRAWDSPDILAYSGWLRRLWAEIVYADPAGAPVLLNDAQEQTLWEEIIQRSDHADELLRVPETAVRAAEAWRLVGDWEIPLDAEAFDATPDSRAFLAWQRAFVLKLKTKKWITGAQLARAIAERIAKGHRPVPAQLFYGGFDQLVPAHQRIFAALTAAGCTLDSYPEDRLESAAVRVSCETPADEIASAAAWARQCLERAPGATVGIVVPDLARRRSFVERVFDDVLHPGGDTPPESPRAFHISAGPEMAQIPIVAAALLALKFQTGLTRAEAGVLLRSPFFRFSAAEGARVDVELRRKGLTEITPETPRIYELFGRVPRAPEISSRPQLPSRWSGAFSRILTRAGWPGSRALSSAEYQAVKRWKELLSEFAALDLVLDALTYSQAFARLAGLAARSVFSARDEGAPIQILGPLEAAGMHFDAAWVAGLDAGRWPSAPRPHPFLPLAAQRASGVPHGTAEQELAYARRVVDRLLASAPRVICSYAVREGDEWRGVSALIADLPVLEQAPVVEATCREAELQEFVGDLAPPLAVSAAQSGGMSVLKDQSACPFRAFATHRLFARELDEPDIGLSTSERGSIVHAALERVWAALRSQQALIEGSRQEIQEVVASSVAAALAEKMERSPTRALNRLRALEQRRLERMLLEWLDLEAGRPAFDVVSLERKDEIEISGLHLRIKADRVDRYPDGTLALIDYKTGMKLSSTRDWEGDRPGEPQLPLYAIQQTEPVASVLFAQINVSKKALVGFSDAGEGEDLEPLSGRIPAWRGVIENLAAQYVAGDARVDPKNFPGSCEFCGLPALCRVGELSGGAVLEDDSRE